MSLERGRRRTSAATSRRDTFAPSARQLKQFSQRQARPHFLPLEKHSQYRLRQRERRQVHPPEGRAAGRVEVFPQSAQLQPVPQIRPARKQRQKFFAHWLLRQLQPVSSRAVRGAVDSGSAAGFGGGDSYIRAQGEEGGETGSALCEVRLQYWLFTPSGKAVQATSPSLGNSIMASETHCRKHLHT